MADEKFVRETDTIAWKEKVNADARRDVFGGGTPSPVVNLGSTEVFLPFDVIARTIGDARRKVGLADGE